MYTERNNSENLQYDRFFFNLRADFTCTIRDFTCMLLSATVQDIESTVQNFEARGNHVATFNGIFLLKIF